MPVLRIAHPSLTRCTCRRAPAVRDLTGGRRSRLPERLGSPWGAVAGRRGAGEQPHPQSGLFAAFTQRRRPESNRCRRLCRPLRSHSATSPRVPRVPTAVDCGRRRSGRRPRRRAAAAIRIAWSGRRGRSRRLRACARDPAASPVSRSPVSARTRPIAVRPRSGSDRCRTGRGPVPSRPRARSRPQHSARAQAFARAPPRSAA
jgi:hypothetical protein